MEDCPQLGAQDCLAKDCELKFSKGQLFRRKNY